MKTIFAAIVCFLMMGSAYAQTCVSITGKVQDASDMPLHKVQLYLFTAKDTVLLAHTESDNQGNYAFTNDTKLDVFIMASRQGFISATQPVNGAQLDFTLYKEVTNNLNEAMVCVARKSTLKHESGKFVFTPKGMDIEEVNAFEMLKHVPLLETSSEDIKIMGIGTSTIYINGRRPIEKGEALMEKIRSISPEQISKIEIITVPGASRSASTKGGIVNIVVKQNYVGWAGTSTTALEYQNKMGMSENLNLRYGKNKFNASVYLSGSWTEWKLEGIDSYDYVDLNKKVVNQYNNNGRDEKIKGSFDIIYTFDKSHKIGVSGSVVSGYNKAHYMTSSETWNDLNYNLSRTERRYKYPFDQKPSYGMLAYYTWTTDTKGSQFNFDIDYSLNSSRQDYWKSFSTQNEEEVYAPYNMYTEDKKYDAHGSNVKASYDWILSRKHNMSFGYELNASKFTNTYDRNDIIKREGDAFSPIYNGSFKYKENVQALYATYQATWSEVISTQLGIRGEYAYRNGFQSATGENFTRHEFDWFPSVNVDFDFVEDEHSLSLGYTRKIRRPFLHDLDPFVFWRNETSYSVGNPSIKPYCINDYSAYYELYEDYIFNLNFSHSKNGMTDYSYQDGQGHTVSSRMNVSSDFSVGIGFEVNKTLFDGRWRLSADISGDYTKSRSGLLSVDETNFDYSEFSGDCSLSSTVKLSKRRRWNAEIYAYGATASTFTSRKVKPSYFVHATLTKTFNFGGMLQFRALNLLYSKSQSKWTYHSEYYAANSEILTTKRAFSITFSIPFGKSNVKGAKFRNSNQLKSRL